MKKLWLTPANVRVVISNSLTVEVARREKAMAIIRGLRLTTEYEQELGAAFNNRVLGPDIPLFLIPPKQEHVHISSTVVRELLSRGHSDLDRYLPPAVLEYIGVTAKITGEKVRERFLELCRRLSVNEMTAKATCNFLVKHYEEPHRAYHTLGHINDGLDELEQVKSVLCNPTEVEIAWFFHDVVYDPRAHDNEEKSAEYAKKMIEALGLSYPSAENVAFLILATKHDVPPADFSAQTLVDIDLASLGCSERRFDKNTDKIRKEYGWASDKEFCKGRVLFLKSILKRPAIYLTQFFRVKYEEKARQNLTRAIAQLSK